jgi:4-hydroxybenzoate polyprenyltransferase
MAAVFAVDPSPSPVFLAALFFCLFFWEIGGQNIPADWTDLDVDNRFKARTIPVSLGPELSAYIVITTVLAAMTLIPVLFYLSGTNVGIGHMGLSLGLTVWILLLPALKLFKEQDRSCAMALFNKASYFPPALLMVVLLKVIFS